MQDLNNIVYIPLNTFQYRFWDQSEDMKDDLDGIDLRLRPDADSIEVAKVVTAVLNSTHHNIQDFSVTIPAACWPSRSVPRPSSLTSWWPSRPSRSWWAASAS